MRYVIYGAGAIGGGIGGRLTQHGHDAVLIARGEHLEAMQRNGLRMRTPHEDVTIPVTAVGHPSEIEWTGDEAVILSMKSQDTRPALEALRAAAGSGVHVICAQNGVDNERQAARRFDHVYAMLVFMPATHLTPGEVILEGDNLTGVLDSCRYPDSVDPFIEQVCADLSASSFDAIASDRVMPLKYAKLVRNLNNGVQAVLGSQADATEIRTLLRDEAFAVYAAAGIEAASDEESQSRSLVNNAPVAGVERGGSSTWQSVTRGLGSIETDYLNGEIAMLGVLYGIPTPANRLIADLADHVARNRLPVGSFTLDEVMARLRRD
jgi:2-dehydropantoate 2-reductase